MKHTNFRLNSDVNGWSISEYTFSPPDLHCLVTLVGLGFPRPPQVHIQRFTALMKEHRPAPSDYMMNQPTT